MTSAHTKLALIVGAGAGLSASIARSFARNGMQVAMAARNRDKLQPLADEIGARAYAADATDRSQLVSLFQQVEREQGAPDVVVYNPSQRVRGALVDLDAGAVERAIAVTAMGGFVVAQEAVRRMLPRGRGVVLFTGASASVKGYALSAPFAMGKFALRGLAQSMARELAPQGIHVAHVVIDGAIRPAGTASTEADDMLDPDAVAETYLHLVQQPRSAWTWEVELRPWTERF